MNDRKDSGPDGANRTGVARRKGGRAARLRDGRRDRYADVAKPFEISDAQLADLGLDLPDMDQSSNMGQGRLLTIACGAIAREILSLKTLNGWDRLDLACLPAQLHNRPDQIAPRLVDAIAKARKLGYRDILIGYGDCGSGGDIDRVCEKAGAARLPGAHCYAFFDGVDAFTRHAETELTAFFLTDYLARQFDAIIWQGLGLAQNPDLLGVYFANYDRVVYLAQTEDPELTKAAQRAASRLGLAFERRFTGYGDLAEALDQALVRTAETGGPSASLS